MRELEVGLWSLTFGLQRPCDDACMRTRQWLIICLLAVLGAACSSQPKTTDSNAAKTRLPQSASLPARWWTWTESMPPAKNPIDDSSGSSCGLNQPQDVWFLAGTHGGSVERRCNLPEGSSIYFPVLNQICVLPGESATKALDNCTASATSATATLDGRPLKVVEADTGGLFDFDAKPNSSSGLTQGHNKAVAWGLWVGPLPLNTGRHVLRFQGASGSFSLSVTYRLQVG